MDVKLKSLPQSWSELTWESLREVWAVKQRYGGSADVARCAALMELCHLTVCGGRTQVSDSGETLYTMQDCQRRRWLITPRELAWISSQALPWFDFPYGDPGEKEQQDENGNVIKERREGVRGYVSPMRDAMILPLDNITLGRKHFALPQVACNNITWQQYRSLQTIVPQLFDSDVTDEQALVLQAQFLAHILTPRTIALLDTSGGSIRVRLHYEYRYNSEQAEGLAKWFAKKLKKESKKMTEASFVKSSTFSTLFHICFQTYQTALTYYGISYPLLFSDSGKKDPLRDALTGEMRTINAIMKYAGYTEQQQVYDSNLPFVLDILNTMTIIAKEEEKMNAKIKKK